MSDKDLEPSNERRSVERILRTSDLLPELASVMVPLQPSHLQHPLLSMSFEHLVGRLQAQENRKYRDLAAVVHSMNEKGQEALPPVLIAVRAILSEGGNTYHAVEQLDELFSIITSDAETAQLLREKLLSSGIVVNVSTWVGDGLCWLAWRRYFEGEASLALSVVRHLSSGGKLELIFGEPGTGKSELVAKRIVDAIKAGSPVCAGSAQNNSARSLEQRISEKHEGLVIQVGTVHKKFAVSPDPEQTPLDVVLPGTLVVDEFAQLDAPTAGAMSTRWKPRSSVLLSLGPGQLPPVGVGNPGEDLLACLQERPLGAKLTHLTENHRAKDANSKGIVAAYQAIGRGEMPKEGPGVQLLKVEQHAEPDELVGHAVRIALLYGRGANAHDDSDTSTTVFTPLDERGVGIGAKAYRESLRREPGLRPGEHVLISELRDPAHHINFRRRERVEVAEIAEDGHAKVHKLERLPGESHFRTAYFKVEDLRSAFIRTGHASQGYEVDHGVVIVTKSRVTNRRWLYVAVSRCRKTCIIVYRCWAGNDDLRDAIAKNPARRSLFRKLFHSYADKNI